MRPDSLGKQRSSLVSSPNRNFRLRSVPLRRLDGNGECGQGTLAGGRILGIHLTEHRGGGRLCCLLALAAAVARSLGCDGGLGGASVVG